MPTAAKLVAALAFGFVAWFASALMVPYLPPNARLGWFHEISAAVGALMGWVMSGARAGGGLRAGLGLGLTTMAMTVFWCLVIFGGEEMIDRSLNVRYEGPITALIDMVDMVLAYGRLMLQWDVLVWLVGGGLFAGIVTELSAREWT